MRTNKSHITILAVFGVLNVSEHETILQRVRNGLDINAVDSGGRTLLMEAVIKGDHTLVDILLANGADPNMRDRRNWTPLHFAAQSYDADSVHKLVEHGAEINAQNDFGNTPISNAVFNSRGRGQIIEFLLSRGADASIKNKSGISAIDLAKSISNYSVSQYF